MNSCVGDNSCVNFNSGDATNKKVVGGSSCYGDEACKDSDIDVGSGSCWGDFACDGLVGAVIEDGACIGTSACSSLDSGTTVGEGACIGVGICNCSNPGGYGGNIPAGACVDADENCC